MDEKYRPIFDTLAKGAGAAISKVGQFAKECKEQEDFQAKQRVEAMRREQIAMQKAELKPHHEAFGNGVGRCLVSESDTLGIKRPKGIDDILCDNEDDNININGNEPPDFSYEAKKARSNCGNLNDIMSGRSQSVPVEDIEKELNRTLKKYTARRGYTFSGVTVDDIPGGKIRITAHDVRLTQEEMLRRNGYNNY